MDIFKSGYILSSCISVQMYAIFVNLQQFYQKTTLFFCASVTTLK
jgi:hypothetical protein